MATEMATESTAPTVPADDPSVRAACADDVCRVTLDPLDPGAETPDDADVTGVILCREGAGECIVVESSAAADEVVALAKGRVVVGEVDADPSGTWRITSLPTKVRCTVAGSGPSSVKVKRTKDKAMLQLRPDGSIDAKSQRADEPPFVMVRLAPGLYGSVQHFTDGKVSGEIVTYYGMSSEDLIHATARITSTLRDGGPAMDCLMKRNLDMKRLSGPDPDTEPGASP
jgi:hypothetical protein